MTSEIRKPGRPRSAQAHQAILDAALTLLIEEGFGGMSIEAVAERAGVGKTTIYRRWPSKVELVIDVIRTIQTEVPVEDTGNLRTDLITMFQNAFQSNFTALFVKFGLGLIEEFKKQPEILETIGKVLFIPRLRAFQELAERAKARGELRSDVDIFLLMGLLAGPFFCRMIVGSILAPTPSDWPEKIVDAVLNGVGTR